MTANMEPPPQQDDEDKGCEDSLKTVLEHESNQICSECPEKEPTWAFLLINPLEEDGQRLGIVCCFKCYGNVMRLGKDVGQVKSTRRVREWTQEEVQILATSGNKIVNDIYECESKLSPEDKVLKNQDKEAFVNNKYKDLKYFSKKTFLQHYKLKEKAGGGIFGTTTSKPSFDWKTFSKSSKPGGDDNIDSSTHSTSSTSSKRRGFSKTFSNPFALESMRSTLDSSRHKDKSQADSELAPPSLARAKSNPFSLLSRKDKPQGDPTAPPQPAIRMALSTTITRMMGTGATETDTADSQEQPVENSLEQDSWHRRGTVVNSRDLEDLKQEAGEEEEEEEKDLSFLGAVGKQPPRRGVARSNSNPRSLDFLRQNSRDQKDSDDASQFSSMSSRRRRAPQRRGISQAKSSPHELNLMRQRIKDTGDETATQIPSRSRRGTARGTKKSNSNEDIEYMRWDLYNADDKDSSISNNEVDNDKETISRTRRVSPRNSDRMDRRRKPSSASDLTSMDDDNDRMDRRRKPSSTSDLPDMDDEETEISASDHGKRKKRGSRPRRMDSTGDSSRGDRSTRREQKLDRKGDSEGIDHSSKRDKSSRGERSMNNSSGRDRSRRGQRSRERKGDSETMERSSKGERTKSRKNSPANSDKSPKRKSRRSPRRSTDTDTSERKSPLPIRRQKSTPSSVLEEGLLHESDGEHEGETILQKVSRLNLLDDESEDDDSSRIPSLGTQSHKGLLDESTSKEANSTRRRSSGKLLSRAGDDSSSNRESTSPRRRSSGRRLPQESGDTKSKGKDLSPKRSSKSPGKRLSKDCVPPLSPVSPRSHRPSSSQPLLRDDSRHSVGVHVFGEGVSELAQIAGSGRRESDQSAHSLGGALPYESPRRPEHIETRPTNQNFMHDSNSSLLDLYPDTLDSSDSEDSFYAGPRSPKRSASGSSAIHSPRSPASPQEADAKGKKKKFKSKVRRVQSLNSPRKSKQKGESERKHRSGHKKSRSSSKKSAKDPTIQDTIDALKAMSKTKAAASESIEQLSAQRSERIEKLSLQRSMTTG